MSSARNFIDDVLSQHKIVVFSKSGCPFCSMAIKALTKAGANFHVVELGNLSNCSEIQNVLAEMTGGRTVPRVFINKKFVGGGTEMKNMEASGQLKKLVA